MKNPDQERRYNATLRAMARAAREWQRSNLHAHVCLNPRPPGLALPAGRVALIGTLHEAVQWLGANEETRQASGREATILMAQAVVAQVFGEPS